MNNFSSDEDDDDEVEDDEDIDADYEDSEYESTESELDEGCSNIKLTVPLHPHSHNRSKKRSCPHKKVISSTEQDSESTEDDESDSETEDSESDSESSSESIDDFSGSETNTECDFTDSEGRPNPFHKELEVPSILIDAGSPDIPGMRRYPEDIIEANTKPSENHYQNNSTRLYKTPNLADKKEAPVTTSNYIGRSTQRAFNLKKHWVSDASTVNTGQNKGMEKSEVDNRLKSLMDRLSNQQKLLKPAEKPSRQMEHFIKGTANNATVPISTTNGMKSISSDPLVTSPLKSPTLFSRQNSEKLHYAPPYQSIMNGIEVKPPRENSNNPEIPKIEQSVIKSESKNDPKTPKIPKIDQNGVKEIIEEEPPPIPPMPEIYIEEQNESKIDQNTPETTFESCNETKEDSAFMTPANELSLNPEDLKESDDIPLADGEEPEVEFRPEVSELSPELPLATSSPAIENLLNEIRSPTESEKSFIQKQSAVKLTDDEIMRIYQERNPLERLAKFNSLKKKQSSVVHDIILSSNSANKPRARRTRVAIPSSSIPDPTDPNARTPIAPPRTRAATEPPMSLPATPLTGNFEQHFTTSIDYLTHF